MCQDRRGIAFLRGWESLPTSDLGYYAESRARADSVDGRVVAREAGAVLETAYLSGNPSDWITESPG